jgi:hypothetical protein
VRKLLDLTNGNSKRQHLQLLAALTQNDTAGTYGYPLNIHRLQTEKSTKRYLYSTELVLDKVNVHLPSLRMKVPDHVYVFGSLLLQ